MRTPKYAMCMVCGNVIYAGPGMNPIPRECDPQCAATIVIPGEERGFVRWDQAKYKAAAIKQAENTRDRVMREAGVAKAKEFLMRGTLLKGREAERIGLVNHCLPAGEVLAEARKIASELAHGPTWAIRWTKLSINQVVKERVNHLLEASMALEQVTFETADHREATTAFKERRKPVFQ